MMIKLNAKAQFLGFRFGVTEIGRRDAVIEGSPPAERLLNERSKCVVRVRTFPFLTVYLPIEAIFTSLLTPLEKLTSGPFHLLQFALILNQFNNSRIQEVGKANLGQVRIV